MGWSEIRTGVSKTSITDFGQFSETTDTGLRSAASTRFTQMKEKLLTLHGPRKMIDVSEE
jgi:hypothetical protein